MPSTALSYAAYDTVHSAYDNYENLDDLKLCEKIRTARDEGALATLALRHQKRVLVIILRAIEGYGEMEDVEELTQDVFLKVWLTIDKYDPSRGTVRKWINMLAKYTAIDFRRRISRQRRLLQSFREMQEAFVDDPTTKVFAKMEKDRQRQILKAALKEFPEEKAQLLIWRHHDGKTYQEIAELIGRPLGTAKSRTSRALRELKSLIYLHFEDG